ncbi:uncharacterized protein LOC114466155 [Gouania willdenowi]|uniref:uncharacterized protein LOC114466155 n=1 Tax=Gouania willdenowi TaxID=441366 RepID=UPI0010567C7B|nr:uncharacterized protein LOC114466155 [Gouania willdenowi]
MMRTSSSTSHLMNEDTCVPASADESRTSEDEDTDTQSVSETQSTTPKIVSVRGSCPPTDTDAVAAGVSVMTLVKKSEGGTVYNKRFYCLYCSKPQGKMARHLERKHQHEPEVERAFTFLKGSVERCVRLRLLTNRGNRAHNIQVLREGRGLTIPLKQSNAPVNASDYTHCFNCEAFLKRKFLRRHMQTCQERVRWEADERAVHNALKAPPTRRLNSDFLKLLREMHQDQVTEAVCSDRYVLKLEEELFLKREYIRQRMRDTGRLLLQGWTTGKLQTITDFVLPTNFPSAPQLCVFAEDVRTIHRYLNTQRKELQSMLGE